MTNFILVHILIVSTVLYNVIQLVQKVDVVKSDSAIEGRDDMIHLDFRSGQPIYEQIITQYKYLILQGYLKNGDAIPSVRKLAMQLEVTPGTVAKAYRELERGSVIETIRGKGTFIAGKVEYKEDKGVVQKVKEEMRTQCMELIYQGWDKKKILQLVEEICENLQGGENDK